MKLYHTSTLTVEKPDMAHSRDYLDFGRGFYLTSMSDQAIRYGDRFRRRGREAWLNTYEFEANLDEWRILRFDSYDKGWLDFVAECRAGNDNSDYDIVIGGIANDKVIQTLDRYFIGEISQEDALGLLKYEKPNIQYCIRSERMLNECLTFIDSKKL